MNDKQKQAISFTAPHFKATQAGTAILESGGTAIEAMVAAAASIAVNYPHMNGLGGDGFWLISEPNKPPIAINAAGVSARAATLNNYKEFTAIPSRGPKAALTMAGAVAGWNTALEISASWQPKQALSVLLASAINDAKQGIEVTQSLSDASHKTFSEMAENNAFEQFLINGEALNKGQTITLPLLATTLEKLAASGLDDFYRGDIAKLLADDLSEAGSPIDLCDFEEYQAKIVEPISIKTSAGVLYNLPNPTQGIASMLILALYDRLKDKVKTELDHVHILVECTKQAFLKRNQFVTDPTRSKINLSDLLSEKSINDMLSNISLEKASPWPVDAKHGDTIWMGACDNEGRMVSYIQSLYWEFGSGIVSPSTGIVWNNRGTSFSLDPEDLQALAPGLQPFHTLNPAFAELADGTRMSYGTMGGEGQPQTQAAIFTRFVYQGMPLSEALSKGRWLLGRTWGDTSHNLKIESDLAQIVSDDLKHMGHDIAIVASRNELMGHAGAVVAFEDGSTLGATDPRSDGSAFVQTHEQSKES
jgi:gamma-glutamyltranspeptidase/glutathione hydrolase